MKKYTVVFLVLLLGNMLLSCTEGFHDKVVPVNIGVDNLGRILVINGKIEQDSTALVQLSYSEDIDATVTTPRVYEKNALVTLTTADGKSETLKYWKDGWYYGRTLRGEVNNTYTLSVKIDQRVYTAMSKMSPAPGYRDAWVTEVKYEGKAGYVGYSDEWRVFDPVETRDRYLFEWWRNGVHDVRRDWSIDDDRVVNSEGSLRLFNVTADLLPNEYTVLQAARIDKLTYDYYNMYEKIVRGIVGVSSQTPYNPVSNFGPGTIGNFRAVSFSAIALLTPPALAVSSKNGQVLVAFDLNPFFKKYHLYWDTKPGITLKSSKIENIAFTTQGKGALFTHETVKPGTPLYYRVQVEDAAGNVSILSPEASVGGGAGGK